MAELTLKLAKFADITNLVEFRNDLANVWSKTLGPNLVFRKLWNDLGFNDIFDCNYHEHILMMVINRLCDPKSKLSCMKWKEGVAL